MGKDVTRLQGDKIWQLEFLRNYFNTYNLLDVISDNTLLLLLPSDIPILKLESTQLRRQAERITRKYKRQNIAILDFSRLNARFVECHCVTRDLRQGVSFSRPADKRQHKEVLRVNLKERCREFRSHREPSTVSCLFLFLIPTSPESSLPASHASISFPWRGVCKTFFSMRCHLLILSFSQKAVK